VSQRDQLLELFHRNGDRLTLGQIMGTTLAAEYRARMSELRADGYRIECVQGSSPSQNLYVLSLPQKQDENEQMVML